MQLENCDRALFLDIDGVFNYGFGRGTSVNVGTIPGDVVDVALVKFLARLLNKRVRDANSTLHVVGCSSWFSPSRPEKNAKLFQRFFSETGLQFTAVTRDTGGWIGRTKAVLDYLVEHKPKYWCVVDDGDYYNSMHYPNHPFFLDKPYYDIRQNFVHPHGRYGLSSRDIESILDVLGLTTTMYSDTILLNTKVIESKFQLELDKLNGVTNE